MKQKKIYITTTLPYVNADGHLGHALEFVQADIIARHSRLLGKDVFFNIGVDEHGQKILQKAQDENETTKEYTDRYAARFKGFAKCLNISHTNFIRTTDKKHKQAAQEFWRRCCSAGDIYKKLYKTKYCIGCELEKTASDLDENGYCPSHPNKELDIREEENYYFRFSKYQNKLISLYEKTPDFVIPKERGNEIKSFVKRGLQDFSISRLKKKMPWGIDVPEDNEHVMYVWFDALVNYVSAIGWPSSKDKFNEWWPVMQIAGKDNLRQQAAMWQAMLLSAGINPSKQIVIHGNIISGGIKMSKSIGNVVNPVAVVSEYGADALRYYLAREITPFEDGDFTKEKFKEAYNANLVNGLGNLVSRILKMVTTYGVDISDIISEQKGGHKIAQIDKNISGFLEKYEINKAMDYIWQQIGNMDKKIQKTEPFKTIKTNREKALQDLKSLTSELMCIAIMLEPFMPDTADNIQKLIINKKTPETPLFPRK